MRADKGLSAGYSTVTETPLTRATTEQLSMLYTRYKFAAAYCRDKDVLEVACGAGTGLGLLSGVARHVVGGDIDEQNLEFARRTYGRRGNIEILRMDAHNLPFGDSTFDVVVMFEALYYLLSPGRFFEEAYRVLRPGGRLIVCTANRDSPGFNPSPLSVRYFSAPEIYAILGQAGFKTGLYAMCPVGGMTFRDLALVALKSMAVRLHLIPRTMKGKEAIKRVLFGRLSPIPAEAYDGMAEFLSPTPISHEMPDEAHKVVFAVSLKPEDIRPVG